MLTTLPSYVTARQLDEAEGRDAVTTRRLSAETEYRQPVLYAHFANMDQLALGA